MLRVSAVLRALSSVIRPSAVPPLALLPLLAAPLAVSLAVGGCASAEETRDSSGARSERAAAPTRPRGTDAPTVATVQLYAGADETALPVVSLDGGETLTLEFDLLGGREGAPLSAYLVHTDRAGRPDLFPAQYVQGFDRADLVQPDRSRGTTVSYVHYRHRFPEGQTRLTVSGAYLVRVTELGDPSRVLFERPFYVAESGTAVETGTYGQGGVLGTGSFLPLVTVSTAREASGAPFGYAACFALDGRLAAAACAERPLLTTGTSLAFTLPTSSAFRGDAARFALDLRRLAVSPRIEDVDVTTDTTRVRLAPDEPTFPDVLAPSTNAQSVVRQSAYVAGDAAVYGEYAAVTFSLAPPGGSQLRDAYVEGSFGGWSAGRVPMVWNPSTQRHEGTALVKQGRHEYRYTSSDARLTRAQSTVLGRSQSTVTAFVFYRDILKGTDRLLAAPSFVVRP